MEKLQGSEIDLVIDNKDYIINECPFEDAISIVELFISHGQTDSARKLICLMEQGFPKDAIPRKLVNYLGHKVN